MRVVKGSSLKSMTAPLFLFDPAHDDTPLASDELHAGWRLSLPEHVRRHAIQVMRMAEGDRLRLSDGEGLLIQATIRDGASGLVEIDQVGRQAGPRVRLGLIQALAKGGRDESAIEAATQLGVDRVTPWQADRSIARWKAGRTDRRWEQVLVAATEQSRRTWKPLLTPMVTSRGLADDCRQAAVRGDLTVVLHQDAAEGFNRIEEMAAGIAEGGTVRVVVGPEGGISDGEAEALTGAGAVACTLGTNILRASTAGPAALTLLARILGRFDRVEGLGPGPASGLGLPA